MVRFYQIYVNVYRDIDNSDTCFGSAPSLNNTMCHVPLFTIGYPAMKHITPMRITPQFLTRLMAKSLKRSKLLYWKSIARIHAWGVQTFRKGLRRLSLFEYEDQKLGHTTIWLILMEARQPRLSPRVGSSKRQKPTSRILDGRNQG